VTVQASVSVRLGGFLLDRSAGGLFRLDDDGNAVPLVLGSRALDVLGVLVERQGELVPKQAIMDAVWPDTAVEENNLTVQISTLRRLLDQGRADGSCIQTVPGRGYRFVVPRHGEADRSLDAAKPIGRVRDGLPVADAAVEDVVAAPSVAARVKASLLRPRPGLRLAALLIGFGVVVGALLFAAHGQHGWLGGPTDPRRLSLVVLPFENLSGDAKDDYLADGITDDLTTELSQIPGSVVIAR
jgi:DNA-binding winged helix-turn-helix (wHTH) protein